MDTKGEAVRRASIVDVDVFFPNRVVDDKTVLDRIIYDSPSIKNGTLERLIGTSDRRFADEGVQVSDLASCAAVKILERNPDIRPDLLIFAAASSDLIEPATANIIQTKLGLACPVMDIKNACNSFVTAMQVASSFIETGAYHHVLVVNGEKLSEVINYNPSDDEHLIRCISSFSLGDAGASVLMGARKSAQLIYQKFSSWGDHWELSTVKGGGSLAFRDADQYYFESNSAELNKIIIEKLPDFVSEAFKEAGLHFADVDHLLTHQTSSTTINKIGEYMGVPSPKWVRTYEKYGNIGAATIPVALDQIIGEKKIRVGELICIIGLAAGISISVQLIRW
jgi:3-oxoacyl-(acyl-carrier-protein) synthase III